MTLLEEYSTSIFAPGRINLIGEHIDYNDGIVLPTAIDRGITVHAKAITGNQCKIRSTIDNQWWEIPIEVDNKTAKTRNWLRYIFGIFQMFSNRKINIGGVQLYIDSTLPIGSGLSSSSALLLGVLESLNQEFELQLSTNDIFEISREVERDYIGVQGGVMDQMAILYSKENSLLKLDCLHQKIDYIPFDSSAHSLLLINSDVSHQLSSSAFNQRRNESLSLIRELGVQSFRELDINHLSRYEKTISSNILKKRLRHILFEMKRVEEVEKAIKDQKFDIVKQKISQCQLSLKSMYEVSCNEIDFLFEYLLKKGIHSRMMGGGFGGSMLVWLNEKSETETIEELLTKYNHKFEKQAHWFSFSNVSGLKKINK